MQENEKLSMLIKTQKTQKRTEEIVKTDQAMYEEKLFHSKRISHLK